MLTTRPKRSRNTQLSALVTAKNEYTDVNAPKVSEWYLLVGQLTSPRMEPAHDIVVWLIRTTKIYTTR